MGQAMESCCRQSLTITCNKIQQHCQLSWPTTVQFIMLWVVHLSQANLITHFKDRPIMVKFSKCRHRAIARPVLAQRHTGNNQPKKTRLYKSTPSTSICITCCIRHYNANSKNKSHVWSPFNTSGLVRSRVYNCSCKANIWVQKQRRNVTRPTHRLTVTDLNRRK